MPRLRLAGGSSALEGRVEIQVNGTWGTVCEDGVGMHEAHVICIAQGYKYAEPHILP